MGDRIRGVGLDMPKDTIVVAVAEGDARGEVREYGRGAGNDTIGGPERVKTGRNDQRV